jgi:DNA-binding transcriptional regulator LsrR (DeoR family)
MRVWMSSVSIACSRSTERVWWTSVSDHPDTLEPIKALSHALVAQRYYIDGNSKVEIAEELGVSRFRVARLLDEARASGTVKIEITAPTLIDAELSIALQQRFGLQHAVVASTAGNESEDAARTMVARVAAATLAETLGDQDVVGIGWGRTLNDVVSALPALATCEAVQVVGGMPDVELWMNSVDLVRRFSERSGGAMQTFLLPYLTDNSVIAEGLRRDPSFVRARQRFAELTVLIAAVGSWVPPLSGLYELLTEEERAAYLAEGAVADMFGAVFRPDGTILSEVNAERAIGITPAEIGQVPSVIGIAAGPSKANALRAVLLSGLVTSVITDSGVATTLLTQQ